MFLETSLNFEWKWQQQLLAGVWQTSWMYKWFWKWKEMKPIFYRFICHLFYARLYGELSSTEGYLNIGAQSTSAPSSPVSRLRYCYSMGERALNSQENCVTCSLIHPQGIDLFSNELALFCLFFLEGGGYVVVWLLIGNALIYEGPLRSPHRCSSAKSRVRRSYASFESREMWVFRISFRTANFF